MEQWLSIPKWVLQLVVRLAPRRIVQLISAGALIIALSAITVYFANFTAGDDLLLLRTARYAKLFLIIVAVTAVAIIIGSCLFHLLRIDFPDGKGGER